MNIDHRLWIKRLQDKDPETAMQQLSVLDDAAVSAVLLQLSHGRAVEILEQFDDQRRQRIAAEALHKRGQLWLINQDYAEGSVGRLMVSAPAVFDQDSRVDAVIEALRELVKQRMVVYVFVVDAEKQLRGVVAFRELVFARPEQRLIDIMLPDPFVLLPQQSLLDAMQEVVIRHYPVYPVCDENGRLLGQVRGQDLFEQQAFEISAQAGAMVGVEKEERLSTPWARSLRFRHPWLQLNLLTVFVSAAVVGLFQDVVDQLVVLAMFLPVLAGQSGNLGSQTIAVVLRGMVLGEVAQGRVRSLIGKEAWMALLNGLSTGVIAAGAMYFIAHSQFPDHALMLAVVTLVALAISSVFSGVAGVLIPLGLKRLGADPATASTIFLTTLTDVLSMGGFLALAAWWVV